MVVAVIDSGSKKVILFLTPCSVQGVRIFENIGFAYPDVPWATSIAYSLFLQGLALAILKFLDITNIILIDSIADVLLDQKRHSRRFGESVVGFGPL